VADDRPAIDAALARRLVDAQFPQWRGLPISGVEPDGHDNRTFRLGDELAVRLPSDAAYAAQVDKEQRWLPVLAPHLPLPIPVPVARGAPEPGFAHPWSVYRWLDGQVARAAPIADLPVFAEALAAFLRALGAVPAAGGPPPGPHNVFRGGPLATYADEAHQALAAVGTEVPQAAVGRALADALATTWDREPVWLHGDVAMTNLLVRDGRLAAVIDFGSCGVGDPACDVVIAWTALRGEARARFRAALGVDRDTWARGRGWALWKALLVLAEHRNTNPAEAGKARRVIEDVLAEHERGA
jgi:aminoglycoside phosphotransferase (APT) family kinase protein